MSLYRMRTLEWSLVLLALLAAPAMAGNDIIYNGVDGDYFDPQKLDDSASIDRAALGIPEKAVVIACVGKLRPEKGHVNLLQAMKRLQTEFGLDPVLLVVGDGDERRP